MLNTIRRKLEWNESITVDEGLTLLQHPRVAMGITPVFEQLLRTGASLSEETRIALVLLIVMTVPDARRRRDEEPPPPVAAAHAKRLLGQRLDARERLYLQREALFVTPAEAFPPLSWYEHHAETRPSSLAP